MGWLVRVVRPKSDQKERLVVSWYTHALGLAWLDPLVESGKASYRDGRGYPDRYSIPADLLMSELEKARADVDGDGRPSPPYRFAGFRWGPAADRCAPSDILTLEAWDST